MTEADSLILIAILAGATLAAMFILIADIYLKHKNN